MEIKRLEVGPLGTNCYLVKNEDRMVVIDPGYYTGPLEDEICQTDLPVEAVLLTHAHFDHIWGVDALVETVGAPVYALDKEETMLTDPSVNLAKDFIDIPVTVNAPIRYFSEGDILELAGLSFKTIWIPGHSAGGCCYYLEDEGVLFSGDSLFYGSIGRTDNPQGDYDALVGNLCKKVLILPDKVRVFPGHGPETVIGFEKQYNPFLREWS